MTTASRQRLIAELRHHRDRVDPMRDRASWYLLRHSLQAAADTIESLSAENTELRGLVNVAAEYSETGGICGRSEQCPWCAPIIDRLADHRRVAGS